MSTKKVIAFDLDGTLAESKSAIDTEMAHLISKLLSIYKVAVISGGDYPQFEKQLIPYIHDRELLKNLYLYPTCGTKSYIFKNNAFEKIYSEDLSEDEIKRGIETIQYAIKELNLIPEKTYGQLIENRGTQITYSALGQEAPYEVKKIWDPSFEKRRKIKSLIDPLLPDLQISMGGSTSIDITKKGIDKSHAIEKLKKELNIVENDIFFIGDALMEGGNDYAVKKTGVECRETSGPEETKTIIKQFLPI